MFWTNDAISVPKPETKPRRLIAITSKHQIPIQVS